MNKDCAMKRPVGYEYEKSDYCLCLAIHAPRKGIVEVLYLGLIYFLEPWLSNYLNLLSHSCSVNISLSVHVSMHDA